LQAPSLSDGMRWGAAPELVGPRHVYRVQRLAALLRSAVPSGDVLDAGCGAGALAELLARRGYRVTAVDASPELVDYTRERIARAGLAERVEVRRGDLETALKPPGLLRPPLLQNEAFDAAVCGEVLEHIGDDDAALHTIAAALKPGGVLALSVPAGAEQYDWLDRWAGHYRRYDEDRLRVLLAGAGLEVETLVRWGFPFMALYERFVQRPGLGRAAASGGDRSAVARLARSAPVTLSLAAFFTTDRLFEGRVPRGTGFLVRARKPRNGEAKP